MRYRPVARQFFFGFVACCLVLGWCGAKNPDDALPYMKLGPDRLVVSYTDDNGAAASRLFDEFDEAISYQRSLPEAAAAARPAVVAGPAIRFIHLAQLMTLYYFAYFLIILPLLGLTERPKDEPDSIHKSVLKPSSAGAQPVAAE